MTRAESGRSHPVPLGSSRKANTRETGVPGGAGSLGVSLASTMVLVVPVVAAYLFLQRYFIESMAGSGVKG